MNPRSSPSADPPRVASRLTIRTRLTLTYMAVAAGSGAILIAVVWALMTFVPQLMTITVGSTGVQNGWYVLPDTAEVPVDGMVGPITAAEGAGPSEFLRLLMLVSVAVLAAVSLASGFVGWTVAGRMLRPLKAVNDAAMRAATGALDHRVELAGPRDEIRDLGDTFNRMLFALDRSFDAHRRFAANASHELRTPMATIQTMVDVTLADPDASPAELRALAERVRAVNERSTDVVDALLDLADVGQSAPVRQTVRLRSVVEDAILAVADEASRREVSIASRAPDPGTVAGDPRLLRQAVSNLLYNAIRHNHPGGTVDIRLASSARQVILTMSNSGPHVPAAAVDSLLEPFVRGVGRVSTAEHRGHGLGLPIVSSIVAAHDGRLELTPNTAGGLTVILRLPRA